LPALSRPVGSRHCRFAQSYVAPANQRFEVRDGAVPNPDRKLIEPGGGRRTYSGVWPAGQATGIRARTAQSLFGSD